MSVPSPIKTSFTESACVNLLFTYPLLVYGPNKLVVPRCRPLEIWADGPAAEDNKREANKIKILSQIF